MSTQEFKWKGKVVSEKQYNNYLRLQERGKQMRQKSVPSSAVKKDEEDLPTRILDFNEMMKHMTCSSCKADLYLSNIKKEEKFGLGSIFHISCQTCSTVTKVPSSKKTDDSEGNPIFEINQQCVTGCVLNGIDYKAVNTFLTTVGLPNLSEEKYNELKSKINSTMENGEGSTEVAASPRKASNSTKAIVSKNSSPRKTRSQCLLPSNEVPME